MSESYSRSYRRYWRRTDDRRPWWPWGLLPFAGLCGLYLIGALLMAPRIEAEVRSEVQQRFDGNAIESTVQGNGQGISIAANAFESERTYIDALARSTQCDTWVGELTCPTTIDLALDEPEAEPQVAVVQAPVEAVVPETIETPPAGAIAVVEESQAVYDRCNEDFAEIMRDSTIQFESASADISLSSTGLLSRIATVAENCPGTLRIEGHTDSQGDDGMNQALSDRRAGAVGAALGRLGIESNRIVTDGFGESQPIADNNTEQGRATNRRIVISVQQ